MPIFSYAAKSLSGEEKAGTAEAKDIRQLSAMLKTDGFILVNAFPQKEKKERSFDVSIPFFSGVSLAEKMMFTRNLQVMIASGLSLPRALSVLALQSKSKVFQKAIIRIKDKIIKGKNFSETLEEESGVFSELFQSMVRVGEEAGNLEEVLTILAKQMEREYELKSKIKGALVYPAVIIFAMIGIGILMLVMVIPKLAETFAELQIELPLTTRVIIGLGTFLSQKWYLGIALIFIFLILFQILIKIKSVRKILDFLFLRLPIISTLVKKTNSASTMRTLSSLVSAGVPLVRSLEIISNTLGNVYYKEAVLIAADKVKKGEKLSDAIEPYKQLYPLIVFQMLRVGEETGETAKILSKLADFFEEEVGNATKNLASVIEPVLMLIIGGVIGFFAISMVQPMYSMLDTI